MNVEPDRIRAEVDDPEPHSPWLSLDGTVHFLLLGFLAALDGHFVAGGHVAVLIGGRLIVTALLVFGRKSLSHGKILLF
jgi:hypothetical protein